MRLRTIAIVVSTVIFIAIWIPFSTVVVPRWRAQVVDINDTPCVKQTVNQTWAHYSLSNDFNTDYQKSDSNGNVEFPERSISKNLIQRIVYTIIAYALVIAQGGVGIHANVYASDPVNAGVFGLEYEPTKSLPDKLIIKRCFVDHDIPDKIS